MTAHRFKPGDVALVQNEYSVWNVAICQVHPGGNRWVYGVAKADMTLAANARPLVVIDPENEESVDPIIDLIWGEEDPSNRPATWRVQQLLREFADPLVEVFEHFVIRTGVDNLRGPDGKQQPYKSLCGKVWHPSDKTVATEKCPECTEIVGGMWTK